MRTALRHTLAMMVTVLAAVAFCLLGAPPTQASAGEQSTVPLLMIVVEFDDGTGAPTLYDDGYDWSATIFGGSDTPASYYLEMSDGAFTFSPAHETSSAGNAGNHNAPDNVDDGIVHVTLPEVHEAWGLVNNDTAMAHEFGKVMMRAIDASRSFVDYDAYDANGDGTLDNDELIVCFCLAGYDASALVDPGRTDIPLVWPHTGYLKGTSDNVKPSSYIALAERICYDGIPLESAAQEPLGVLYHELGHTLGLPDLYPLNDNPAEDAWGAYSVGALSLMDAGGWAHAIGQNGEQVDAPMALDAWSRYVLGWEMPQVATQSGDYMVSSQLSVNGYQSLLIPTADPNEYYIVENRQPEGIDEALSNEYAGSNPQGGLVIWHVDKTTFREFSMPNTVNNTTHQPAIMETFFELFTDGSGYATVWDQTVPNTGEPFYDASSCVRNYGNSQAQVTLPLYNDDPNSEVPAARVTSNVTLTFPTDSAREMTVHVEFASEEATNSSREYALGSATMASDMGLSDVVCSALMRETGADVAFVDTESITAGIPEGGISWADIYAVAADDSNIVTYTVSGSMILETLEQVAGSNDDAIVFSGVTCTIDKGAPAGSRVSEVAIGSDAIDPAGKYTAAFTKRAYQMCPAFTYAKRDLEMLWGSPADALRSFMLLPNWEETTAHIMGERTYIEPPAPAVPQIPELPVAAIALAAIACVLAVIALALLLRRTRVR